MILARRSLLAGLGAVAACRPSAGDGPRPVGDTPPSAAPARDGGLPGAEPVDWVPPEGCPAGVRIERPARVLRTGLPRTGLDWVDLSPDGRVLAARDYRTVHFARLDGSPGRSFPLGGPSFGALDTEGSLAWDDSGEAIWLLVGETSRPGFSTGPLSCARLHMSGRVEAMPPLRDLPGRLDQVAWVNRRGLGLALIDTRGGYYRPEQTDPNPGLAVIDAARGVVRAVMPGRETVLAPWGRHDASLSIRPQGLVELPDGRVRVVAHLASFNDRHEWRGGTLIWTEGDRPEILEVDDMARQKGGLLSPDGSHLLVQEKLQPDGIVFDMPNPPPVTPRTGIYASVWDLGQRRRIRVWRGTARSHISYTPPALSEDGRYGAIGLPEKCDLRGVVGIVDMRTGRIRRRLATPYTYGCTVGFHRGRPWAVGAGRIEFHR